MKFKTFIEIVSDGDNANEAIDKAGEYLRGSYHADLPMKVKTLPMASKSIRVLAYTIAICFLCFSFSALWFGAGRTYQKIAAAKEMPVETYAVTPPVSMDMQHKGGIDFKKSWDELFKEKVLYEKDENIDSRKVLHEKGKNIDAE